MISQTAGCVDVLNHTTSGACIVRGSRAYWELQDWPLLVSEMPVFVDLEQLCIFSPLPFSDDVTHGQALRLSAETQ